MIKPALSDEILMRIDKPARYIGNEVNMVKKDLNDVDIRFAMCFPDVYEIGIWGFRFCMICLIRWIKFIVKEFILHGMIWTRSCGNRIFRCLHWKHSSL